MPDVFHMVPPAGKSFGWLAALLLVPLALTLLLSYILVGSRRAEFEVSRDGLRISGHVYGRRIPAGSLLPDQARIVDLNAEPDLRPGMRTNGIGLPGYQAGWFRLTGRRKALLFVTDRKNVVYLPTTEGYVLMMTGRPSGRVRALAAERSPVVARRKKWNNPRAGTPGARRIFSGRPAPSAVAAYKQPETITMGRGDKRTRKGKIFSRSYGKTRPRGGKKTTSAAPKKGKA